MKVEDACQFIFHPWSEDHSFKTKIAATIADIALAIISGGLFLIPFLYYQWKDRDVKVVQKPTASSKKVSEILGKPDSSQKKPKRTTPMQSPVIQSTNSHLTVKARRVKEKQAWQLAQFEQWASAGKWSLIHSAHYDWWMYPVDYSSRTTDRNYQLNAREVEELKTDLEFMVNFRRGVVLGARAWGWDVLNSKAVDNPAQDQKWQNWNVRLGKMIDSLDLFGELNLVDSMRKYARQNSIPVYN